MTTLKWYHGTLSLSIPRIKCKQGSAPPHYTGCRPPTRAQILPLHIVVRWLWTVRSLLWHLSCLWSHRTSYGPCGALGGISWMNIIGLYAGKAVTLRYHDLVHSWTNRTKEFIMIVDNLTWNFKLWNRRFLDCVFTRILYCLRRKDTFTLCFNSR